MNAYGIAFAAGITARTPGAATETQPAGASPLTVASEIVWS